MVAIINIDIDIEMFGIKMVDLEIFDIEMFEVRDDVPEDKQYVGVHLQHSQEGDLPGEV